MEVARVAVALAALLFAGSCGNDGDSAKIGSDTSAISTTSTTLDVVETTETSDSSTTSPVIQDVSVFPSTASEFEARVEIFGEATGHDVGTFAPVEGSNTFAAPAGAHVVGYHLTTTGELQLVALLVGVGEDTSSFTTPAQLLSVVATTPVGDADNIEKAIAVFQRETLPDLSEIGGVVNLHAGGAPYYELRSVFLPGTGVLFLAEPSGGPSIVESGSGEHLAITARMATLLES